MQAECYVALLTLYRRTALQLPTQFGSGLMLVEGCVVVEAKAVEKILPLHKAQFLGYMKLLDVLPGLLINFHEMKVTHGISRLILPGANL